MRKCITAYLLGILTATLIMGSLAIYAADDQVSITVALNKINLIVNGKQVAKTGEVYTLDNGNKIPFSIMYKGTTYLPMKKLGSLMNKDIIWDNKTLTASVRDSSSLASDGSNASLNSEDFINSKIMSDFDGFESGNIYELMNGQFWKQTSYHFRYSYKFMPKAIMYKDGISYKMKVDGIDQEITVERVK